MPTIATYASVTGQELEYRLWQPEGEVRGVVQVAHGMAEHIARYDGMARALNAAGFVVVGNTHLGHGERATTLGYFADHGGWDALLDDMDALRRKTQALWPDAPYFLLGHSMGSFLARTYCLRYEDGLRGVILSGTGHFPQGTVAAGLLIARLQCLLGMARKPSKLLSGMSFGANNKRVQNPRTGYDWLSTDPAEVDKYIADPYCGFDFTAGGFRDLFTGLKRLAPANLSAMKPDVPVWLFSGAEDPVGDAGAGVQATADELRAAGVRDVSVTLYAGGRHEMFNERDRARVLSDLIEWMSGKLG